MKIDVLDPGESALLRFTFGGLTFVSPFSRCSCRKLRLACMLRLACTAGFTFFLSSSIDRTLELRLISADSCLTGLLGFRAFSLASSR